MKTDFENYKKLHDFLHPEEPLKSWINSENFNDIYYEDWNSLLEIIEKIESFEDDKRMAKYNVIIEQCFVEIIDNKTSDIITSTDENTKIEALYKASLSFVDWHKEKS